MSTDIESLADVVDTMRARAQRDIETLHRHESPNVRIVARRCEKALGAFIEAMAELQWVLRVTVAMRKEDGSDTRRSDT